MNRRTFLKTLGMVPAVALAPSILISAEAVPEFLEIDVNLNTFGNRVPDFRFRTKEWMGPAYIVESGPIVEHVVTLPPGPTGYFVQYIYTTKVKILNTAKFRQSEIKTIAVNNSLWITT